MSIIDDNKDKIEKELKNIIEKDENILSISELKKNTRRPHYMKNWISIDLNQEVVNSIDSATNLVLEDDYIKKTYSPYHVKEKIKDIISETFSRDENERIQYLEEKIENLRSELKTEIKEWLIQIPIYNLRINEDIEVGTVKFFVLDRNKANEMKKELGIENEDFYDIDINPNINTTLAEIKVEGIKEYAQHIAITKINLAINALKLFIPRRASQFKAKGTIQEDMTRISYLYVYDNENDTIKLSSIINETIGQLHPITLRKGEIDKIKGMKKLSDILKKNKLSQFEQQLILAIIWFSEALSIYDHSEKYLPNEKTDYKQDNFIFFKFSEMTTKFFTSLESILTTKEENITESLSERIALILEGDYSKRIKLKKKIKELYGYRSKIIHTGNLFISKKELYELLQITRSVLIKIIELNDEHEFKTMQDLDTYFNKIKYDKKFNTKKTVDE